MAYRQYFDSASLGSTSGYVEYTITPNVGSVVAVGEEVTITGKVYSAGHATNSIVVYLRPNVNIGGTIYPIASLTKTISKGSTSNFTIKFTMPDDISYSYVGRATNPLYIYFRLNASSGYSITTASSAQYITILKSRLNPSFSEADFVRCTSSGTDSDEGTYIKIAGLKVVLASGLTYSDISSCYLTYTGSSTAVNLSSYTLVNSGYSESSPSILSDKTFLAGQSYTFTVNISDGYDTYSIDVDTVPRAFANMHLSGATTGGVAFGMFSSSSNNNSKFESAYPAYLYGGIAQIGNESIDSIAISYSTSEQTTGRKWYDGKSIYQITYTGSTDADGEEAIIGYIPTGYNTIIKIEGAFYDDDTSTWYGIPHAMRAGSSYSCACYVKTSDRSVVFNVGSGINGTKTYYITVYYTKS